MLVSMENKGPVSGLRWLWWRRVSCGGDWVRGGVEMGHLGSKLSGELVLKQLFRGGWSMLWDHST